MTEIVLDNVLPTLQHLNCRKEIHGEELVLACDVTMTLTRKQSPTAYDALASMVLGNPPALDGQNDEDATQETIEFLTDIIDSASFSAKLENQRVSLRQNTRKLAIFGHATLDKFALAHKDAALTFRIRGPMDHQSIGRLAGAMRELVSMDLAPAQTELDLTDADTDEGSSDE